MTKKPVRRRILPEGALLPRTRRLLRRFGLQARKGLGQHFLIDEGVLWRIVASAGLSGSDFVLEVGPGLGVLTRELAGKAGRVVAIEMDDKLAAILKETLASFNNVTIVNADILEIELPQLVPAQTGYKVVANLPYYITSAVLRRFLEASFKPETMVVMVQKEVAGAIVAGPGQMSLLSVSVQFYGKPEIIDYVPARCFYPPPEVDSAILRIDIYPRPAVAVADEKGFFELVRAGFTASRKQIANSLAQGLNVPKAEALSLLAKAGITARRRAETLTLEEWGELWLAFRAEM